MVETPFTFYRGAAKLMAQDLVGTPATGVNAQICGDAHLSNFGFYGAPDRALVFDVNDFDETLPGPWEWDVKRLAASFAIAARNSELGTGEERDLAEASVRAYRKAMGQLAGMGYLDGWYSRIEQEDLEEAFGDELSSKQSKKSRKKLRKARGKDSRHVLGKLAEETEDGYRIISQPPLILPIREVKDFVDPEQLKADLQGAFARYLDSVPDHTELLLRRFRLVDFAFKVVGVGSVGTRCWIVLLEGRDASDPLFLQIKEATRSVLEDHLPLSKYPGAGQRVVEGQRLMQAASDSFLGWTDETTRGHNYYWRQLKDMKASPEVEEMDSPRLHRYARLCGWTLARAHARSAPSNVIAEYLGKADNFDKAVGRFAVQYADQNDADYREFRRAVDDNEIPAWRAADSKAAPG